MGKDSVGRGRSLRSCQLSEAVLKNRTPVFPRICMDVGNSLHQCLGLIMKKDFCSEFKMKPKYINMSLHKVYDNLFPLWRTISPVVLLVCLHTSYFFMPLLYVPTWCPQTTLCRTPLTFYLKDICLSHFCQLSFLLGKHSLSSYNDQTLDFHIRQTCFSPFQHSISFSTYFPVCLLLEANCWSWLDYYPR